MCKKICTTVLGLAIVLLLANLAGATVVNAELSNTSGGANQGEYSGQGAYSDPGNNYWNPLTSTGGSASSCYFPPVPAGQFTAATATIEDSAGNPTTVTFGVNYLYGNTDVDPCNPQSLFGSNICGAGTTYISPTFTIGGLIPGSKWFMYLYAEQQTGPYGSAFTFYAANGGGTYSTTGASGWGFQVGVNYVVTGTLTADSNGQINCQWAPSGNPALSPFNGFQLISAVPEPGTLTLLGWCWRACSATPGGSGGKSSRHNS